MAAVIPASSTCESGRSGEGEEEEIPHVTSASTAKSGRIADGEEEEIPNVAAAGTRTSGRIAEGEEEEIPNVASARIYIPGPLAEGEEEIQVVIPASASTCKPGSSWRRCLRRFDVRLPTAEHEDHPSQVTLVGGFVSITQGSLPEGQLLTPVSHSPEIQAAAHRTSGDPGRQVAG